MASTKKTAKKAPAKKAPAKKAPAKKAPAEKAPAKKAPAKKAPAKKAPAKKAPAKKAPAKKAPAKKAPRDEGFQGEMLTMEMELPAPPAAVYAAWLDPKTHGAMTGAAATGKAKVGAPFTAWDGYIQGQHLHFVPNERIVQSWRTSEFAETDPDSQLDLLLSPHRVDGKPGTRLFLIHSRLPAGGAAKYAEGWAKFYFEPMTAHFSA
jgi:uncharacterized protein YndB with AHSA1/START domain